MSNPDVVGPLLSVLMLFAGGLGIVALVLRHKRAVRELLSRERMAALDKGVEIPWEADIPRPRRSRRLHLKVGILLTGAAVGLALVAILGAESQERAITFAWAAFFAVFGLTNILYDRIAGKAEWERSVTLDEALTRAYIQRLEGGEPRTRDAHTEDSRGGR
jgi:hypothetical protein